MTQPESDTPAAIDPENDSFEEASPTGAATPAVFDLFLEGEPKRLDAFIAAQLPQLSRAQAQRLIEDGHVTVPSLKRPVKPALRLPRGARVHVVVPPPRPVDLTPQDIPIEILYEDVHLAVIDKPAGLAAHPSPNEPGETLVNALLYRIKDLSSVGGVERPGIIHRLDKETSGVLVVAKNDMAHRTISTQFKERAVRKTYLAIARGELNGWEGCIDLPLGRSYTHSKKQVVRVDGTGREALTEYRVLEKYRGYALVECYPRTGRTHQIRVHLASIHLPVACDKLYGRERAIYLSELAGKDRDSGESPLLERHALHAQSLSFRHPVTQQAMTFSSNLHEDMHGLLKALERHRSFR